MFFNACSVCTENMDCFRPGSDKNDQWGGAIVESNLEREAVVGMSVDRLPMGSNLYAINLGCWFEATRPSHQRFALLCLCLALAACPLHVQLLVDVLPARQENLVSLAICGPPLLFQY